MTREADGAPDDSIRKTLLVRGMGAVCLVAVLVAVAYTLKSSGLLAYARPETLRAALAKAAGDPLLPAYVCAAFLVAGALLVSPWLVIAQVALLAPAPVAFPVALAGALLSATTFYGVGRLLGAPLAHRVVPRRVQQAVDGAGLGTVVVVRAVPALPYTLVNLCAGAFRVPFGTYLLGTTLGMSPGILAFALLGERVVEALTHPSPRSVGLVIGAVTLAALALVVAKRARR